MKFIVDLSLDGFEDEAAHDKACKEFIEEQLNMTASSVKVEELNLQRAFNFIKPHGVEVEYIESGTFQGGEEQCFLKGATRFKGEAIVFHPEWEPHCSDEAKDDESE